jgi:hypothetical protein
VDGAHLCPECGAALKKPQGSQGGDQGGDNTPGGRGGQAGQGRRTPAAGPADAEDGQPAADTRPGQHGQQPGVQAGPGTPPEQSPPAQQPRGPPADGPGGGGSGGVSRRTLLAGGAGVLAAAGVGGWYFFLREPSPVAVARRSWEAWTAGDFEAYEQVVHTDSPLRDRWPQDIGENFGPPEGAELTMESRELVEQGGTEATVREVYVWNPPDGSADRVTDVLGLRTEAGAWRLWDVQNADAEPVNG